MIPELIKKIFACVNAYAHLNVIFKLLLSTYISIPEGGSLTN